MGEFAQQDLGPTEELPRTAIPRRRATPPYSPDGGPPMGGTPDVHAFTLVVGELRRAVDELKADFHRFEERWDEWCRFHDGLHRELAEESAERRADLAERLARVEARPDDPRPLADGTLREQLHALRVDFARWKTGAAIVGVVIAIFVGLGQIAAQVWAARPPLP